MDGFGLLVLAFPPGERRNDDMEEGELKEYGGMTPSS